MSDATPQKLTQRAAATLAPNQIKLGSSLALLGDIGKVTMQIGVSIDRFVQQTFGGADNLNRWLVGAAEKARLIGQVLAEYEVVLDASEKTVYAGLPKYSWFYDPRMDLPTFVRLAGLIAANDEAKINEVLMAHFSERIDEIETAILSSNPSRQEILRAAFRAHRDGSHVLSIPTFLAQADGISCELLGEEYFVFKKSKDRPHDLIAEVTDDLYLTGALRILIPKGTLRIRSEDAKPGDFNRHAILHGSDTSYGTQLNSFKSISLLNFMSEMNGEVKANRLKRTPSRPAPSV